KIETMRDSMIGSLGAIDTAGLLQSLSTAKKTGLLTVENRDKALIVAFYEGKPLKARMDRLRGYEALVEFLVVWSVGIFVFRDKGHSDELLDDCKLTQTLDRVLLDSALCQDQVNQILALLPQRRATILERVWNFEALWSKVASKPLKFIDESTVSDEAKRNIF